MTVLADYFVFILIIFQYRLDQFKEHRHPPPPSIVNYKDVTNLTANERWGLYWKILIDYRQALLTSLDRLEPYYRQVYLEYEELRSNEDLNIMREKSVVGMTTTGKIHY